MPPSSSFDRLPLGQNLGQDRESSPESEQGFSDIVFTSRKTGKRGRNTAFVSSDPSRKMIELDQGSLLQPTEGESYEVVVVTDTQPDDPMRGKYLVKIVPKLEDMQKIWENAEAASTLAEPSERQRRVASRVLYAETGIERKRRQSMDTATVLSHSRRQRVARRALQNEELYSEEADQLIGEGKHAERAFLEFQRRTLMHALRRWDELEFGKYAVETLAEPETAGQGRRPKRQRRKVEAGRQDLLQEEIELLKSINGVPNSEELGALSDIRGEIQAMEQEQGALFAGSPEAYYGLHLRELLAYQAQGKEHRIVETPYVRAKAEDILTHYRAGKPVLIYGHLGSGKTELAMHIAREYLGKEALVISGSKHTSLGEIYGHQVLTIDQHMQERLAEGMGAVEQEWKRWKASNPEASADDAKLAHDRILQFTLTQFQGGTISKFLLGPLFRAMEEGRPVIIDEVNAIPHEVLISLNYFLTRKAGETVTVQQEGGRELKIQEGFGVMMTGNLNQGQQIYVDRKDLDPAFLSRLHKTEYDYLPMITVGDFEYEAGAGNELFHLILAKVIDRNGNLQIPKGHLKKLWKLAQAARLTQDVFSGKHVGSFVQPGSRDTKYLLKESVLSNRSMDSILSQWQKEGYRYELDHYVWKEFIEQSTSASDRAYLYQVFRDQFGFFLDEGWPENPPYGSGGQVAAFNIHAPEHAAPALEFFGPRDVVDAAYGSGPERKEWPGGLPKRKPEPPPPPDARGEVPSKTEQEREQEALKQATVTELKRAFEANEINRNQALVGLCGIDTPEVNRWRGELWKPVDDWQEAIAVSLQGCESEQAWGLRNHLVAFGGFGANPARLKSLRGCVSNQAWNLRDIAYMERQVQPGALQALVESLAGDNSERAWNMREVLFQEMIDDPLPLGAPLNWQRRLMELASIVGIDDERADKIRSMVLLEMKKPPLASDEAAKHKIKISLLRSVAGLSTKFAYKIRDQFKSDVDADMQWNMSFSLAGCNEPSDEDYRDNNESFYDYGPDLAGSATQRAKEHRSAISMKGNSESMIRGWYSNTDLEAVKLFRRQQAETAEAKEAERKKKFEKLKADTIKLVREAVDDRSMRPEHGLEALCGIDTPEAFRLRELFYRKCENLSSLAKSLIGCDSDEAWIMRDQKFGDPAYLDVKLRSIIGCESIAAWDIREQALARVVNEGSSRPREKWQALLDSMAGDDSDRAWEVRDRLATLGLPDYHVEILRSLVGIDSPKAWEHRKFTAPLLARYPSVARLRLRSVAGIDTKQAWDVRNEDASIDQNDTEMNFALSRSLVGLEGENVDPFKFHQLFDESEPASLAGSTSAWAEAERGRLWSSLSIRATSMLEGLYSNPTLEAVNLFRRQQAAKTEGETKRTQEVFKDQADVEKHLKEALFGSMLSGPVFNIDQFVDVHAPSGARKVNWLKIKEHLLTNADPQRWHGFLERFFGSYPNAQELVPYLENLGSLEYERPPASLAEWETTASDINQLLLEALMIMGYDFKIKISSGVSVGAAKTRTMDEDSFPGFKKTGFDVTLALGARIQHEAQKKIGDLAFAELCSCVFYAKPKIPITLKRERAVNLSSTIQDHALWIVAQQELEQQQNLRSPYEPLMDIIEKGGGFAGYYEPTAGSGGEPCFMVYLPEPVRPTP